MEKKINVMSDIESRRRISERRMPSAVVTTKEDVSDGRTETQEEADTHSAALKEKKPRTRKAEGDA